MFFFLTIPSGEASRRGTQEQLIHQALLQLAAGDTGAIGEIYKHSSTRVFALALSILGNPQDAEDILHDTYIQLCRMADRYNGNGKPLPWILTITRNLARMKLRRHSSSELPLEDWQEIQTGDSALTAEDRLVLSAALTCLDETERQVVMLHAVAGFKHREIAQIVGLSLPGAISKYRRAIKKLANRLQEDVR